MARRDKLFVVRESHAALPGSRREKRCTSVSDGHRLILDVAFVALPSPEPPLTSAADQLLLAAHDRCQAGKAYPQIRCINDSYRDGLYSGCPQTARRPATRHSNV